MWPGSNGGLLPPGIGLTGLWSCPVVSVAIGGCLLPLGKPETPFGLVQGSTLTCLPPPEPSHLPHTEPGATFVGPCCPVVSFAMRNPLRVVRKPLCVVI